MHHWGLKRIHGRVWTLLFLSNAPLGAVEIVRALRISKGLGSLALKELVAMQLVRVAPERTAAGRRRYVANNDIQRIVLALVSSRQQTLFERVGVALSCLTTLPGTELQRARLAQDRLEHLASALGAR